MTCSLILLLANGPNRETFMMQNVNDTTPRSLQEEIHQTRPFSSKRQEAWLAMFRTVDDLERRMAVIFAPAGITQQQYNVLRILRGAGPEGLPTLCIADRMIERTPGITRLIDRLQKKGWVKRNRATCDRRQVVCTITDAGLQLLSELDGPIQQEDDEALSMLNDDEITHLIDMLARIRAGLRGRPTPEG